MEGLTPVPPVVQAYVASALIERERRRSGATQSSLLLAAHLASAEVDDAIIEKVHEWHQGHADEVAPDSTTVSAGLVGGIYGRTWAAAHVAKLSGARRRTSLKRKIHTIEQRLAEQLWTMAEQATRAAVDKAQVKVKVRTISKRRDSELAAQLAALTSWKPSQLAAAGVTEQELIANAYAVLEGYAPQVIYNAKLEQLIAVAAAYDVTVEELMDEADDDELKKDADHAAHYLALALGGLLLAKITGKELTTRGEGSSTMSVPFGLIRQTLRVASGSATLAPVSAKGPGPASSSGVTVVPTDKGSIVQRAIETQEQAVADQAAADLQAAVDAGTAVVSGDGSLGDEGEPGTVVTTWVWVYGFYGQADHEFYSHTLLDQLETDNRFSDPALTVSAEDSWLDVDFYFPGDHEGCTCEWVSADG